jgi:hypothetical protein
MSSLGFNVKVAKIKATCASLIRILHTPVLNPNLTILYLAINTPSACQTNAKKAYVPIM